MITVPNTEVFAHMCTGGCAIAPIRGVAERDLRLVRRRTTVDRAFVIDKGPSRSIDNDLSFHGGMKGAGVMNRFPRAWIHGPRVARFDHAGIKELFPFTRGGVGNEVTVFKNDAFALFNMRHRWRKLHSFDDDNMGHRRPTVRGRRAPDDGDCTHAGKKGAGKMP